MKKTEKLMILISVVLVSLLAIGAVSAADTNETTIGDDTKAEHTVEPTTEPPVAPPEPVEKPEVTEPTGTFDKLDDEIVAGQINHKGNVTLDKDYKNTDGHGITIKKQTHVDSETGEKTEYTQLNLDGQNHIIDGNYNQTIFTIEDDMTVVMKNLIFINGNDKLGGAIYNEGYLILINVTFMNNWAENLGGAIYNDGKITMINTTFIENNAGSEETVGVGGAIYNSADDEEFLKIINATFIENAADYGGAIYNDGFGLLVKSVGFFDNFAEEEGGAIYNNENVATLIENVAFAGNEAWGSGGAIYNEGDFVNAINHAWFISNLAGKYGGAIYTNDDIFGLNDTWFYNNTVISSNTFRNPEGGAIYGANLILGIANSTFEENSATNERGSEGNGGAISVKGVFIDNCGFEGNWAALEGGAIKSTGIMLNNSKFLDNTAKFGGAIFLTWDGEGEFDWEGSYINDTYFGENTAIEKGGAIYSIIPLDIEESEFKWNDAIQGGAIYSNDLLYVCSSNFTENGNDVEYSQGGAIYQEYSYSSKLNVTGTAKTGPSIFVNDIAAEGSEIYVEDDVDATVSYVRIANKDKEESLKGSIDTTKYTKFITVTYIYADVVNNETGNVAIIIQLFDATDDDEVEDAVPIFGEKFNWTLYDEDWTELGNGTYSQKENIIFLPELYIDDLSAGNYTLYIEYLGRGSKYFESDFDLNFEVVNLTAEKERLKEEAYEEGYADGSIDTERYYENERIPKIEEGYEKQIEDKNATIKKLEEEADVLIEGKYWTELELNNTKNNLTKTTQDLAAKTTEAANLQAQVGTLTTQNAQLTNDLNNANNKANDANAKIQKVKTASKIKKSKNLKVTVTLNKKVKGKYVYVIFNGKAYKAKTNSKGIAKITIKKSALKKLGGKKIKYQIVYNQSIKNKSVKIKK